MSVKPTPPGSEPILDRLGAGKPVVVTRKLPALPAMKVVEPALLIAAAWSTFNLKACLASGARPLAAVIVSG